MLDFLKTTQFIIIINELNVFILNFEPTKQTNKIKQTKQAYYNEKEKK
jgi:hypothetical protein